MEQEVKSLFEGAAHRAVASRDDLLQLAIAGAAGRSVHIVDVITEAVAAEREACAKIAEALADRWKADYGVWTNSLDPANACLNIAADIRARGTENAERNPTA